ncbi:hypothetical protein H6CHR_05339 [Variovorax sp. PBL-H6]|nr:hypothetical protein H6CHR_05339 [Variovorax sp. PBL-H6]
MISRSPASSQQLARETRERFVAATEGAIAPIALAVRERLAALAGMTASVREMQQHRDDYLAYQAQGSSWVPMSQSAWRKALIGVVQSGSTGGLRLELIGDEVVETNILSSRLAQSIQDKAQFELNDLRLRIQHLEGTGELDPKDVLKPEALARTLVDQWLAAGLSRETWARVQDVVQQRLVEVVVAAYKDANAFLIERGVMPEIDLKSFVKRTGSAGSNSAPLGGSFARSSQPGSASFNMGGAQAMPGGFGAAPGSFAPAAIGVGAGRGPGTAGGDTLVATGGSPLVMARQRAQGVLLNLKRFVTARIGGDLSQMRTPGTQGPAAGSAGGPGGRGAGVGLAAPAFAAAIADAEAAYQAMASQYVVGDEATAMHQTAAELRRRTSELKKKAPTTADKATVEIVALMFQAILAEERIPFSARVWFARLQMPVL